MLNIEAIDSALSLVLISRAVETHVKKTFVPAWLFWSAFCLKNNKALTTL